MDDLKYLKILSHKDPTLVSIVFKKSTLDQVREYGNKLWEMNPTAYWMEITEGEERNVLVQKKR